MTSDRVEPVLRKPRAELQDKLIDAALDAFLELTPADLVTAVGTRVIAERAGVAATSLFHQFGSVAGFADAIIGRVFSPVALPLEAMTAGIAAIKAAGLPLEAATLFHRSEFARLTGDRGLRLRMGLWSLGAGTTDEVYRDFLRTTDARLGEFVEQMLRHWGREVRPPFTMESWVAAQVALLNGLSIRHLVDPELSSEDNFSLVASALTTVTARARGDRHDLADRLAEMNYYPLRNVRTGKTATGRTATTRATLMAAAAELFGAVGYEDTTVAQIARKAGSSTSTIYRQFGGKDGLATALFSKQAEDFLATRPLQVGTTTEVLLGHLVDAARFVGDRAEHAPAYQSSLLCSKPHPESDPLLALTADRVAAAVEDGSLAVLRPPMEVAQVVLGVLIGRVLAAPAGRAEDHVQAVASLVLGGPLSEALTPNM